MPSSVDKWKVFFYSRRDTQFYFSRRTEMVNTNTKVLPRKWYWAGFLSYLVPGLGQVYNGLLARGLLYYCLFSIWGSCLFVLSLNAMKANFNKLNVILLFMGLFIALIIFVYIIVDAIRQAKKQASPYHLKGFGDINSSRCRLCRIRIDKRCADQTLSYTNGKYGSNTHHG